MAPSAQLKEAIADVHEGIRAILLGPPGAGKGTQFDSHVQVEGHWAPSQTGQSVRWTSRSPLNGLKWV
ncbi:Adenylate kinase 2, mitochondrial [Liparis tanakae]|uniref:Adenylate kinase 2, mitochondrial n=1 Tax=Liparis tanakae TaxID=230148 RepID=A0A4Z2ELK8_9TELE|nr:Adenylate kinase 2, mitochondrial [Liparis tanakae]